METVEQSTTTASALAVGAACVVLHGVSFAYQTGREVLRDIDLEIRPGEHLAIVGRPAPESPRRAA